LRVAGATGVREYRVCIGREEVVFRSSSEKSRFATGELTERKPGFPRFSSCQGVCDAFCLHVCGKVLFVTF
jgi:hypothetical protein